MFCCYLFFLSQIISSFLHLGLLIRQDTSTHWIITYPEYTHIILCITQPTNQPTNQGFLNTAHINNVFFMFFIHPRWCTPTYFSKIDSKGGKSSNNALVDPTTPFQPQADGAFLMIFWVGKFIMTSQAGLEIWKKYSQDLMCIYIYTYEYLNVS